MEATDTTIEKNIDITLDQLKIAREHSAGLRDERRKMIEKLQATPAYKALDEAAREADATITALEDEIHKAGMELYLADAALPERTSVKHFTVVKIIDPATAKEWALHNFTPALKLDEKTFEAAAKQGGIPSHLVVVTKEPRIQIATKL